MEAPAERPNERPAAELEVEVIRASPASLFRRVLDAGCCRFVSLAVAGYVKAALALMRTSGPNNRHDRARRR